MPASQSLGKAGRTRPGKSGTTSRARRPAGRRSIDSRRSSKTSNERTLVAIWYPGGRRSGCEAGASAATGGG
jgi:hypothetical protein